ncbi:MAG: SCO family protein [Anaerolineae bacterium]|nr:SCO family protein [Anaerolineae bacterium]
MTTVTSASGTTKARTNWISYLVIVGLIGSLFFVGLKLGSALSKQNSGEAASNSAPGAAIVNPPVAVLDHTLTDQNGQPLAISSLRGKVTVLFFGYTHCPDVCPTTLADYKIVSQQLGTDAAKVNFVFVTVDPERDDPAQIKSYLSNFDSAFIGLTADIGLLTQMASEYGATFTAPEHDHKHSEGVEGDNYFISHTSPSFVIDPDGTLRLVYFYGSSPETMATGIRSLMK